MKKTKIKKVVKKVKKPKEKKKGKMMTDEELITYVREKLAAI